MKSAFVRTALLAVLWLCALGGDAFAAGTQNPDNPECLGDKCGRPKEEGGGGCGCGASVWVDYTDDGDTLAYGDDADGDGQADPSDNCPFASNRDQADGDGDGVGDVCENCVAAANKDQADSDGDGKGDACDDDIDGDGKANGEDNCKAVPNPGQANHDTDPDGDACDADDDGDGVPDATDTCPLAANPDNSIPASDPQCVGGDSDGDQRTDAYDNCAEVANPGQEDLDADGLGDACDPDDDADAVPDANDNCRNVENAEQADSDRDGAGDECDALYCYVIDPADPSTCLDPDQPFTVSAGRSLVAQKGEKVKLPLFANRNGVGIEYEWVVKDRPDGSEAGIEHPKGAVSASRDWQYAYPDGQVPTFTADADGAYRFQLTAKLVFPDRLYPDQATAKAEAALAVDGGAAAASGCSAIPGALAPFGLLALVPLFRRRRR